MTEKSPKKKDKYDFCLSKDTFKKVKRQYTKFQMTLKRDPINPMQTTQVKHDTAKGE